MFSVRVHLALQLETITIDMITVLLLDVRVCNDDHTSVTCGNGLL